MQRNMQAATASALQKYSVQFDEWIRENEREREIKKYKKNLDAMRNRQKIETFVVMTLSGWTVCMFWCVRLWMCACV